MTARMLGEDDDEAEIEDRGQALIERRQKERKQLRKAKVRGQRLAHGDENTQEPSAIAQADDNPIALFARGSMDRSISRARTPSATVGQASEGYFYPHVRREAGSETPRNRSLSPSNALRPPSVSSSTADEEEEYQQDQASNLGDVVAEVLEAHGAAASEENSEEEDEEGGEVDEAVTLKDRQDVSG